MKLTVLADNNTYIDRYYLGEPAVSYYIEEGDIRILFDTGYSDAFMKNAESMGIDLHALTHIVLSHGHNDHTGGLQFLAEKQDISKVELLAHPDCFLPKYDEDEYIGAPFSKQEIAGMTKYHPEREPYRITDNLWYLGEIPRMNTFEAQVPIGIQKRDSAEAVECMIAEPDYVRDDTALVYKTENGLFIITGCSHSGICNIIAYAKQVCGEERILGVLGGLHLFEVNKQMQKTISYMNACNMKQFYPCHCVSLAVKAEMMKSLPVKEVGVGMKVEV